MRTKEEFDLHQSIQDAVDILDNHPHLKEHLGEGQFTVLCDILERLDIKFSHLVNGGSK